MNLPAPQQYVLHVEPDFDRFRFSGRTDIKIRCGRPLSLVTLNILDLVIDRCDMIIDGRIHPCTYQCDHSREVLDIALPRRFVDSFVLRIGYEGEINDKMAGFYRSSYENDGQTVYIAVTQFQESDARRAFPCFDNPQQKATFDIEMVIDEDLTAISNMDVLSTIAAGAGKKLVRFRRTPKMSTYLVFFGVGDFETATDVDDPRVRVIAMPGRTRYASTGLEYGRHALGYCENYFGVAYPLPKMDLLAIPDFAFGAMENWGAITFRENLLLDYPQVTSSSARERIFEVTAHEIVHQWFGNLVTPSDWKYLWLNESFATYFGYGVVRHHFPDWLIDDQFLQDQTAPAMARDALHETLAIEIPGGEHVVINTATAPIIYSKGASILRQTEGYIRSDNFRNGLRRYLESYAYDNATSQHLWKAFEAVSDRPVAAMMQQWVQQPGFPLVKVRRHGNRLRLSQQRFTYLPGAPRQTWPIPVHIALFEASGNQKRLFVLMTEEHLEIDIDPKTTAFKLNANQTGFFHTSYLDSDNLEQLGCLAASGDLNSRDRWGLENDLFALVKRGDRTLKDYLCFLEYYQAENGYLPLSSIAANLVEASLIVEEPLKAVVQSRALPQLEAVVNRIGIMPAMDEHHGRSLLRDQILWPTVLFGSSGTRRALQGLFEQLASGGQVSPNIMKRVLQAAALQGDRKVFDWFVHRLETSDSEHERLNLLAALGCFSDPDCIARARRYALEKVPPRNKFIPVVSMASNPAAVKDMWPWFLSRLDDFEGFHPLLFERVIAAIVPISGLGNPREVVDFLGSYLKTHPQCADVIRLSLERLNVNMNLRRRCRSEAVS